MNRWLKGVVEQVFGIDEELPRKGKLVLSKHAVSKMVDWGLSEETLKLTYEVGEKSKVKGKPGMWQVKRTYQYYSVGLWYVEQYQPVKGTVEIETVQLVITCWKGSARA